MSTRLYSPDDIAPRLAEDAHHYGFFSAMAAKKYGYVVYRTLDGREVATTCVTPDPTGAGYEWSDREPVGKVVPLPDGVVRICRTEDQYRAIRGGHL